MSVWSKAVLCTDSDITAEVGSLVSLFQVNDTDRPAVIAAVNAAMKKEFGEMLKTHLPDIYARYPFQNWPYSQWIQFLGFTYAQTDSIIDLVRPAAIDGVVGNYTSEELLATAGVVSFPELTTTAAALFVKRAYIKLDSEFTLRTNLPSPHEGRIIFWTEEAKKRWKDSQKRLWIDFSGSGEVQDVERLRLRRGLQRG
jgi:hypothetical protein